jgi:NAD(P)-dependent dehydrogenase (short-subunit alcohol dehydrogenase family)
LSEVEGFMPVEGTASKALLVTGGGRGIGSRIAVQAAGAGFPVVVAYRSRREEAEQTLSQIRERGADGFVIRADMGIEEDILRVFDAIDTRFDGLAGLVNNAATNGGRARVIDLQRDQLALTFETNVYGPWRLGRRDHQHLLRRQQDRLARRLGPLRSVQGRTRSDVPRALQGTGC